MEDQLKLNPNSVNGLSESSAASYNNSDDEDTPVLSSHALSALKEFLSEQQSHSDAGDSEVSLVSEDWRLSQFWYDSETAKTVAEEVLTLSNGVDSRIACIACPTLYAYLKKMDPNVSVQLLEYDKRFEQYGSDFTFYDYNHPEELPSELKHSYKVIVADPPYLVAAFEELAKSAWKKLLKQCLFSDNLENHFCFYSQAKCRKKGQLRSWTCILAVLDLIIPASLEMNFDCFQTMTLERDSEDGKNRYAYKIKKWPILDFPI